MSIFQNRATNIGFGLVALVALSACEEGQGFNLGNIGGSGNNAAPAATQPAQGRTVEQDVEAPDVFSTSEAALWDGRPSLGGVWVAHPEVKDPERVIIRNVETGKFVVGALFRREREIPGPRLQVSSDAAAELGVVAGTPVELNVTALRREEVVIAPPPSETPEPQPAEEPAPVEEPAEIETTAPEPEPAPTQTAKKPAEDGEITQEPLDPIAAAVAAIDNAPETEAERAASETTETAEAKPTAAPLFGMRKPFLQVGIYTVEENAYGTADTLRGVGVVPNIIEGEKDGKPFWRVVAGPAENLADRRALLGNIRKAGFADAYPVTN